MIQFFIPGKAKTAGSKRAGVVTKKGADGKRVPVQHEDGRYKTFVQDSSGDAGKNWRTDVRAKAEEAMSGLAPMAIPTRLDIYVYVQRPKGHFGSGRNASRLKDSAPTYPTSRQVGDCSKLARALEDAIIGIVFMDDSLVTDLRVRKRYADSHRVGALVRVEPDGDPLAGQRGILDGPDDQEEDGTLWTESYGTLRAESQL